MRRHSVALACLMAIPAALPATAVRLPAPHRSVAVIAHRGGAGIAPENTLAALRKAAALKADYVEVDVRTTRDGKLALMHDATVDRTTNGKGAVRDLTLAQLRALRVHGPSGTVAQPVPTLQEALAACKGKVRVYLDQKDADTRQVIAALKAVEMHGNVLVYNDPDDLLEWRKLAPTVAVLPSLPSDCRKPGGVASFVATRPADGLDGHMLEWTPELVAQSHAAGRPVYADVMGPTDNPQGYAKAIEMGIDGLQTDFPDRLAAYLDERKAQERPVFSVRVGDLTWGVDATGRTASLRGPGGSIAAGRAPMASVRFGKVDTDCTAATASPGKLQLRFGDTGAVVTLDVATKPAFTTLSVASVTGPQPDRLTFVNIPLTAKGEMTDPVCASALALNLKTDVPALPGPSTRLEAACEKRFGLVGARVALMARPYARLRDALKAAVASSPDLPASRIGGPWAMDAPEARGSYLFNFGDMTVANVGEWVRTAKLLGVTQIDFHGGASFRFGDCRPNPVTYPNGRADFKAVIDKLHEAGIKAGLHTYAFFIDKQCSWVTPRPDPRLAKSATFTLAEPLAAGAGRLRVNEGVTGVSPITGFFVRNSALLRVDDELIQFTTVDAPGGALAGLVRGACGTRPADHAAGAKVDQLKECFGLLVPDPKTDMLAEVAAATASMYNECGFDMIYLDALDGEDILGGADAAWHYGSTFVYELAARLKRPALMEMSTFHHHLWTVRSRMGAWDHPNRSHQAFIDLHVKGNETNQRMYLPGQLGWWAVKTWHGAEGEPTFREDMEYLMAKCVGSGAGFALMGIDPNTLRTVPALPRLAEAIRAWEQQRLAGVFSAPVRDRLVRPGALFTLLPRAGGIPELAPVTAQKQRVDPGDERTLIWKLQNPYAAQSPRIRIEALTAAPAGAGDPVIDPSQPETLTLRQAATGITAELKSGAGQEAHGGPARYGVLTVSNGTQNARGSWAQFGRTFAAPLNLSARQGVGLWVRGDGLGEVLNVQMRSPDHLVAGIAERYIIIDFTGWRYFRLVEPEGLRWADYAWPYGNAYSIYREGVAYGAISEISLWVNNVPPGKSATLGVGAVEAIGLADGAFSSPTLRIGGSTITFPVEMMSGSYLEYDGAAAVVYGPKGEELQRANPVGGPVKAPAGASEVSCSFGRLGDGARARVTLLVQGAPFAANARTLPAEAVIK